MSPPGGMEVEVEHEHGSKPALTPPTSEDAGKRDDSGSELSDLELEQDDNGEIIPDHYYEGGKIPVFKPTMDQFQSFKTFISKIDKYGMKSGIVKVIPPKEWRDALPALDEKVKTIKVKNPITQEFHGTHGTYTQANIEKQRSYNLPQWKAVSEESNHQPPAKRGERRKNQEAPARGGRTSTRVKNSPAVQPDVNTEGKRRGPGRPRVRPLPSTIHKKETSVKTEELEIQVPPTPTSPAAKPTKLKKEHNSDDEGTPTAKTKGRQPKSVSSRRQHNRRDQVDIIDEEAFKDFDYRVYNQNEWTPERCAELETLYWKGLTFNNPMYGADMPGSLFDDSTTEWNVAKLENLLDVLGQKVPGVNTAYLYLGMWKATFAWHLEDVDLYSINYIHFGAPKQWYSISQADARRFEAAMRNVWSTDAKNCDQFLRHKTYLISPQLLQSQYNIHVNRLVHNEGEFVITFPYGYHSGYNLGYNCAESVNFATESWLDYGKVARKCNCEADSVWVDVFDIERKLRGEPTPEYYEETEEDDEEDEEDDGPTDLPTPPGSSKGKPKIRPKKKRDAGGKTKVKKLKIVMRSKAPANEPCILCPNDYPFEELLPTDDGRKAHRRCGEYTPETDVVEVGGVFKICNIREIDKARWELKCNHCRNKKGSVFQCSMLKCTKAYHATCAFAAGVQVDVGDVPWFAEDGTEYIQTGRDFRCRIHRPKRGKHVDDKALEESIPIRRQASKVSIDDVVQAQYLGSDIFAAVVRENRRSELMLLVSILPNGPTIDVEYRYLLFLNPGSSHLMMPSKDAKPMPAHLAQKSRLNADATSGNPKPGDPFCDPDNQYKWSEFHDTKYERNPAQVKVDLTLPKKLWFYLGKTSTEAKAQYTGDLSVRLNDPSANFLETVKYASAIRPPITRPVQRQSYPASYPTNVNTQVPKSLPASYPAGVNTQALNAARARAQIQQAQNKPMHERPYNGKYAVPDKPRPYEYKPKLGCNVDTQALQNQRAFQQAGAMRPPSTYNAPQNHRAPQAQMSPGAPMVPAMQGMQHPSVQTPISYSDWNYANHNQHQQKQIPSARTAAPVANMTGSARPVIPQTRERRPSLPGPSARNPFLSKQAVGLTAPPEPANPEASRPRAPSIVDKYPYLRMAEEARPRVYQSPYAPGGGFTTEWLPIPVTIKRERGASLSGEFLMTRSPSQQEQVKIKVKEESAIKNPLKRSYLPDPSHQRHLPPAKRHSISNSYSSGSQLSNPLLSSRPLNNTFNLDPAFSQPAHQSYKQRHNSLYSQPPSQSYTFTHQNPQPSFYDPQPYTQSPTYSHTSYSTTTTHYPSYQHHYSTGDTYQPLLHQSPLYSPHHSNTLQYQTPQDFQMQLQRDSGPRDWDRNGGAFGDVWKQGGGGVGHALKAGQGGEMLPMMSNEGSSQGRGF